MMVRGYDQALSASPTSQEQADSREQTELLVAIDDDGIDVLPIGAGEDRWKRTVTVFQRERKRTTPPSRPVWLE